jgi:hypothetical protein
MNDTQVFLIHLSEDKIGEVFAKILVDGAMLEPLDPRDLGDRWQNVIFLDSQNVATENQEKMHILEKVISKYSKEFDFEENYESGRVAKVLENWQEKYLVDAAKKLLVNSIVNKKFLQQKSILKKIKGGWEVTILKDLKALYTRLEIESKILEIKKKTFRLTNDSDSLFVCFIAGKVDVDKVSSLLDDNQIDFEMTTWIKPIIFDENANTPHFKGLVFENVDRGFMWIFYLFNIIFCSIILHDILFGLIILLISMASFRFETRTKLMSSQMWVGFGSIVIGIISGNFGGNLLKVWSISSNEFIKKLSLEAINFLSLFKIVDWTNSTPNYLINTFFVDHSRSLYLFFVFGIMAAGLMVVFLALTSKIIKDLQTGQPKVAITGILYVFNIIVAGIILAGLIPNWFILVTLFGLFIYQWQLSFGSKIKSFIFGSYGVLGSILNLIKVLWFCVIIGLSIGSSALVNVANEYFNSNVFVQIILNFVFAIVLWQVTFVAVQKSMKSNFLDYFVQNINKSNQRYFDPITKYKYWKF